MGRTIVCFLTLSFGAFGQTPAPDSPMTQALLTEIRQLRHDLDTTVATIVRMQVVMYRVQTQGVLLSRASQRAENARNTCETNQRNIKGLTTEIGSIESMHRTPAPSQEADPAAERLKDMKSTLEMTATELQRCQAAQAEAETQLRLEQAKMNELEDQLDKLDKVFASYAAK